jgi:hypothetical protein
MKKNREIQIQDVPALYLDTDLFCGSLDEIAAKVLAVKEQLHAAYLERDATFWNYTPWELYEDIRIEVQTNYYYGDFNVDVTLGVYRTETDAEYKAWRKSESEQKAASKANKEARERALLEELKKKYEQET